uniref:BMP-2-inducible protein kinase n=1 Tax=Lygus hesperus TaxID=30085 RepID=A0A0A9YVN4_LYGHE
MMSSLTVDSARNARQSLEIAMHPTSLTFTEPTNMANSTNTMERGRSDSSENVTVGMVNEPGGRANGNILLPAASILDSTSPALDINNNEKYVAQENLQSLIRTETYKDAVN